MPRPLRKRARPKPETVKITRIDGGPEVEIVRPDELQRRKDEADWQRYRQAAGLDVREEHARLALALGDVFVVPTYTNDIWWFVRDVNGVDRTITAATFIFDQPTERTFPFDLVQPRRLFGGQETLEADSTRDRLGLPRSDARAHGRRRQASRRRAA